MTRTLVVAGKIGPAFATYAIDQDRNRRRAMFGAKPVARCLINVDRAMFFRNGRPDFAAPNTHTPPQLGTGMYYVGSVAYRCSEDYPIISRDNRQAAFHQSLYAAMPPHPSTGIR